MNKKGEERLSHVVYLLLSPLLIAHPTVRTEPSYCSNDLLDLHHSVVSHH
jgi:hypothetical protein